MTKVCNVRRHDWDQKVSAVLWAYRTTCKQLTGYTPFHLVYGQEVVMPMDYIVSSLRIATIIEMIDTDTIEEILVQLVQMEEECFIVGFHQNVEKKR